MSHKTIQIKRLHKDAVIPSYQTPGSAAFDFHIIEDVTIASGEIARLRTGLVICTPEDHALILASRSSSPIKHGLQLANGIGVIDMDYCGATDEIQILVQNIRDEAVSLAVGDRIAQGLIVPVTRAQFEEAEELDTQSRGGFGSTGV